MRSSAIRACVAHAVQSRLRVAWVSSLRLTLLLKDLTPAVKQWYAARGRPLRTQEATNIDKPEGTREQQH